jgi:hypothetical protein
MTKRLFILNDHPPAPIAATRDCGRPVGFSLNSQEGVARLPGGRWRKLRRLLTEWTEAADKVPVF